MAAHGSSSGVDRALSIAGVAFNIAAVAGSIYMIRLLANRRSEYNANAAGDAAAGSQKSTTATSVASNPAEKSGTTPLPDEVSPRSPGVLSLPRRHRRASGTVNPWTASEGDRHYELGKTSELES